MRPYKANNDPTLDTGVAPDTATSYQVGSFVAYRDTDDPDDVNSKHFHVGKVVNIADGEAHIHCYATHGKALSRAQWQTLYQNDRGVYNTGNPAHGHAVVDQIPVDEDEWTLHYNVQLTNKGIITK